MDIQTKFSPGDWVNFMDNNKARTSRGQYISLVISDGNVTTDYKVEDYQNVFSETDLFATPEELIAEIFEDKTDTILTNLTAETAGKLLVK